MGDMFRSEQIALCQLFIQPEAAFSSVSELGEAGCVQFRDLNEGVNLFQRKFVTEVRRCDELERKIRYIKAELKKDGIVLPEITDDIPRAPNPREIIDLEAHLEKTEKEILELAQNEANLKSNYLELTELCQVLENTTNVFLSAHEVLNPDASRSQTRLAFVAGVINCERVFAFERMLWRISRGNVFLKRSDLYVPLKDPVTGYPVYKTVFVAFFQGEQLKMRIKKVCVGFHASIYPCSSSHNERDEMVESVRTRLEDLKLVLSQTEDHRSRVLTMVSKHLPAWSIMVKKMKSIYHVLNLFNMDVSKKCLIGECWVPTQDLSVVQNALADGSAAVDSTIPSFMNIINTNETPPTYNRTNKFTQGFQNLIDAYGIASYREVNPALYTIITFPFLFAVMFGDLGHGLLMFLFGAWMCICEGKLSKQRAGEIWKIFFSGRYIILLMSIFSLYTGFIYNDIFSKSLNLFGSTWRVHYNGSTVLSNKYLQLNPNYAYDGIYTMGLDPIWQLGENKIIFLNSYKMKLSIIFGLAHMLFGVSMSVVNYINSRKYASIVMEFVPQVLFLLVLFGYMVFMMFFKWVKYTAQTDIKAEAPNCAPSVLIMFINMVLAKPTQSSFPCEAYMFKFQPTLQTILVATAFICIPWMLLTKPFYILGTRYRQGHVIMQNRQECPQETEATFPTPVVNHGSGSHSVADEPMSEIFIHQAIHTIEYVLSTISHTASYLRLWALSLAHAQLSEVLWKMVLKMGFRNTYMWSISLFFAFAAWAVFTLGILVMMEGLSAFLHTLRLHWVEFMSKFYEGLGHAFAPFSFKVILGEEEEE